MIVPFSFWKTAAAPPPAAVPSSVALVSSAGVGLANTSNEVGYYNDVQEWRRLGVTHGFQYIYFVVNTTVDYFAGTPSIQRWGGGTPHITFDPPELTSQSDDGTNFQNFYRVRVYPVAWVASASEGWAVFHPSTAPDAQFLPGTQVTTFQLYNNV